MRLCSLFNPRKLLLPPCRIRYNHSLYLTIALSTMAGPFFTKLPLETRNQVYEELLLGKDATIIVSFCVPKFLIAQENDNDLLQLRSESHDKGVAPHQLYPNILRTCKQAFPEASTTLYEKNVFRYSPVRDYRYEPQDDTNYPRNPIPKRIKHVRPPP